MTPISQNERVLAFLREHPGATAIEVTMGCSPWVSNPRARMSDLRKLGYRIDKVDRNGATGFVVVEPARQLEAFCDDSSLLAFGQAVLDGDYK